MTNKRKKPVCLTDDHLIYLDDLRESGVTNMWGAEQYLESAFGLDRVESRDVLLYWMATFGERHNIGA